MIRKALVYVVANGHLLVNWHCDFPEAGIQVPGGTIEVGESPADASRRELYEEGGLVVDAEAVLIHHTSYSLALDAQLDDTRKDDARQDVEIHDRHFVAFHLQGSVLQPFIHTVSAGELDRGIRLAYFWVPIGVAQQILGSGHQEGLAHLGL